MNDNDDYDDGRKGGFSCRINKEVGKVKDKECRIKDG